MELCPYTRYPTPPRS